MAEDKFPILSQIYVFILAIVTMSLTVLVYHCIVVRWCNQRRQLREARQGDHAASNVENSRVELIPSHKYRKGAMGLEGEEGVCPVCLNEFEEGEELRTLPECVHSFHVSCIDMWLYSHSNCPMCRANTALLPLRL